MEPSKSHPPAEHDHDPHVASVSGPRSQSQVTGTGHDHGHDDPHHANHNHEHHDHRETAHHQEANGPEGHAHPAGSEDEHSHSHRSHGQGGGDSHNHDEATEHTDDHHGHAHGGWRDLLSGLIPFGHGHSHDIGDTAADQALGSSEEGLRAVKLSLVGLGVTAVIQVVIAVASGSVGLLADTIHNAADALTAIPLWIAFTLGRRAPTNRYSYGYGRAEDAAGLAVVAIIFISAAVAAWVSLQKLLHPHPIDHLGMVALGAIVGFIGNEVVAHLRISAGERIGSAALVADGQHARADGITSLSVLFAVLGTWLGFPLADPIVGLLITFAILAIGKDAAVLMWRRLMDAVDPELLTLAHKTATAVPGVRHVNNVRARWIGHRMLADLLVEVDRTLTVTQGHEIAEMVRHALLHRLPRLDDVVVHIDPERGAGTDPHALTAHHGQTGK